MAEEKRLKAIFDSACSLFINKGYAETKMKDIAKDASISVGSMYDLFKNKDALLDFIFMATLDDEILYSDHDYPIESGDEQKIIDKTQKSYEKETQTINHHLLQDQDTYSLSSLVSDLFNTFNKYGQYFLILEKNPQLNMNLIGLYKNYRNGLYDNVAEYLSHSKNIRTLDDANYDSMLIVDLIFWWSTHKKYDSFENTKNTYSVELMEKTINELLVTGYKNN